MAVNGPLPPNQGAPLHGDAGKHLRFLLNTACALIGFSMLAGLAHKMGFGHAGPAQANQTATPNAALKQTPAARPGGPGLSKGPPGPTQ
jgi:hypothetical protein